MNARQPTLIVGVGSPVGDDRQGWRVAELLAAQWRLPARRAARPIDLLDWLDGVSWLVLCDSCQGAGPPGSVLCWEWPRLPAVDIEFGGTHDMGLLAVCHLAERLGILPPRVTLWGIEVGTGRLGPTGDTALSPLAEAAAHHAAKQVADALQLPPARHDLAPSYPP